MTREAEIRKVMEWIAEPAIRMVNVPSDCVAIARRYLAAPPPDDDRLAKLERRFSECVDAIEVVERGGKTQAAQIEDLQGRVRAMEAFGGRMILGHPDAETTKKIQEAFGRTAEQQAVNIMGVQTQATSPTTTSRAVAILRGYPDVRGELERRIEAAKREYVRDQIAQCETPPAVLVGILRRCILDGEGAGDGG